MPRLRTAPPPEFARFVASAVRTPQVPLRCPWSLTAAAAPSRDGACPAKPRSGTRVQVEPSRAGGPPEPWRGIWQELARRAPEQGAGRFYACAAFLRGAPAPGEARERQNAAAMNRAGLANTNRSGDSAASPRRDPIAGHALPPPSFKLRWPSYGRNEQIFGAIQQIPNAGHGDQCAGDSAALSSC